MGPTTLRGREEHLSTKEDLQQVSSILQILIEHTEIVFSPDPCAYVTFDLIHSLLSNDAFIF